jgi:hypothetical protein
MGTLTSFAWVRRTHNPLVVGSNPTGPTTSFSEFSRPTLSDFVLVARKATQLHSAVVHDLWRVSPEIGYGCSVKALAGQVSRQPTNNSVPAVFRLQNPNQSAISPT